MRLILCLLVAAFPVLGLSVVQAGEKPGDYLTKDGKLKEPIEVRELQGGFAGFFLYLRKRAKRSAEVELEAEWSKLQRASRTS